MAKSTSRQSDESAVALKHLAGPDPLERAYLFYGEDMSLINKLIDAVEFKRFKGKGTDPLSWEVYRANETPAQQALESVRTISMFGGVKVVIYRDIDKLCEADLLKIADYLQNPVRAHFILTATSIDNRKKSWKSIKDHTYSVQCANLDERNINEYILAICGKLKFTSDAVDALANCIGPNRALLERAIEKLSLAIPPDQTITPETINEHVIDTRERSVFELTRAITKRNIPDALAALRILLDQKQEPVVINGMLARHARMMLQIKLGRDKKLSDNEIVKQTGINPYALREYNEAIRNYSLPELFRFQSDVFETDRALKSKPVPPIHVLSKLLLSLCRPL